MGLFDIFKRKGHEEKNTEKSKGLEKLHAESSYDIICTACFEKTAPNKVVFRANHTNTESDPFFQPKIDSKLNNYRRRHNLEELTEIEVVIDPNNEDHKKYISRYTWSKDGKLLYSIIDKSGELTKKRLCPHCHNELPNTAGKVPVEIISVVGSSTVGKSVYMTVLLHELQHNTSQNFNASFMPIASKYLNELKKNEKVLYDRKELLPATPKEDRIEPLALNFKYVDRQGKPEPTLMFFDVAGEGMLDPEYIEKHAAHIKNSTGIIFLIDPQQIKQIAAKINLLKDQEDFSEDYVEPKDIITKLYENFIVDEEDRVTQIPTAVVVTKSDMLDILEDDYISKNSNILKNFEHKSYFDLTELENIDGEVKNFVSEVDAAFKSDISAHFKNVAYFAVSSLGEKPIGNRLEQGLSPKRVDEPLLWLLYKRGYIDGR